ncbi:hypothetical protein SOHN41_02043 [Shewanella sp. HN-41]|nr:hypothetical protein SOHN41_02043 [Shewanella sp. HN-41]
MAVILFEKMKYGLGNKLLSDIFDRKQQDNGYQGKDYNR